MIARTEAKIVNTVAPGETSSPAPKSAEPADVLPAPDFVSCDPVAVMAKLFVKSAQQKREADSLSASGEDRAEDAADAKRIAAMKDKADKTLAAGIVGGMSQVASGAASICGGASAMGASGETAQKAAFSNWEGTSAIIGGSGKVNEAIWKNAADGADQNIARAESEGKVAKRASEALHKEVDAAAQHEGKVIQLLQEIKQAQAQCEHAALLRMA